MQQRLRHNSGRNMSKKFEWTDENVAILTNMWHLGAPARDIAKKLDTTRNAVIGKANRLGLSTPKVSKKTKEKKIVTTTYPDDNLCQWPSGHPDESNFRFCGKPIQNKFPYCEEHCNLAYRRINNPN